MHRSQRGVVCVRVRVCDRASRAGAAGQFGSVQSVDSVKTGGSAESEWRTEELRVAARL